MPLTMPEAMVFNALFEWLLLLSPTSKSTDGMGVDLSETGIQYARKMTSVNNYKNLNFDIGDISYFDSYEEGSFDGIILSNVLDVMPKDVAVKTFKRLTELLSPKGLMFVKLNEQQLDRKSVV